MLKWNIIFQGGSDFIRFQFCQFHCPHHLLYFIIVLVHQQSKCLSQLTKIYQGKNNCVFSFFLEMAWDYQAVSALAALAIAFAWAKKFGMVSLSAKLGDPHYHYPIVWGYEAYHINHCMQHVQNLLLPNRLF